MSSTPIAPYYEPTKFQEPQPFAPYDTDDERFVYGKWEYELMEAPRDCLIRSCWCISIAQISARVNPGSYGRMVFKQLALYLSFIVLMILMYVGRDVVLNSTIMLDSYTSTMLVVMAAMVVVAWILGAIWAVQLATLRGTVRERFQIEGTRCDDFWAMWCCTICGVAQMAWQTKSHECSTWDMEPRDALPAYQV